MKDFIESIDRENATIKIRINSDLGTCRPIYLFTFNCHDQETAELLTRHLREELDKFKKSIAVNSIYFLEPFELTELKKKLKNWNIKKASW